MWAIENFQKKTNFVKKNSKIPIVGFKLDFLSPQHGNSPQKNIQANHSIAPLFITCQFLKSDNSFQLKACFDFFFLISYYFNFSNF
jgi:hypothetical protein